MQTDEIIPFYYGMMIYLIYAAIDQIFRVFLYSAIYLGNVAVCMGFALLAGLYITMLVWFIHRKDCLPVIPGWVAIPVVLSYLLYILLTTASFHLISGNDNFNEVMSVWVSGDHIVGIGWLFILFTTLFMLMSSFIRKDLKETLSGFLSLYIWFQLPGLISVLNRFLLLETGFPAWSAYIIYAVPFIFMIGLILTNNRLMPDWGRWLNMAALAVFFLPHFLPLIIPGSGGFFIDEEVSGKLMVLEVINRPVFSIPVYTIVPLLICYKYFRGGINPIFNGSEPDNTSGGTLKILKWLVRK